MSKTKKKKKHRLFWHFFRIQLVLLVLRAGVVADRVSVWAVLAERLNHGCESSHLSKPGIFRSSRPADPLPGHHSGGNPPGRVSVWSVLRPPACCSEPFFGHARSAGCGGRNRRASCCWRLRPSSFRSGCRSASI